MRFEKESRRVIGGEGGGVGLEFVGEGVSEERVKFEFSEGLKIEKDWWKLVVME